MGEWLCDFRAASTPAPAGAPRLRCRKSDPLYAALPILSMELLPGRIGRLLTALAIGQGENSRPRRSKFQDRDTATD